MQVVGTTNSTNFLGNKYNGEEATFNFSNVNFATFNQKLAIGIDVNENQFGKLFVKTMQNAGIYLDLIGASNYSKILFAEVTNPTTEIIKVQNTALNYTPFLLESSGKMEIHNGQEKILQLGTDGILRSREIIIDAIDWPDYVFHQSYHLNTLKTVEKFIQKNSHLPEVPNAKEIEENGMNIAEINKILLKKIEEMTLYLIQHEKEIKIRVT